MPCLVKLLDLKVRFLPSYLDNLKLYTTTSRRTPKTALTLKWALPRRITLSLLCGFVAMIATLEFVKTKLNYTSVMSNGSRPTRVKRLDG